MTILMTGGDPIPFDEWDYYDELDCTWCGGEGIQENDDPLWHGFDVDYIPCQCCNGTGLRRYQTIF
jgi:DnaJ-class molecular chaperone